MSEVIVCGICSRIVYEHSAEPIVVRTKVPTMVPRTASTTPLVVQMAMEAERAYFENLARAEQACVSHFESRHPRRLWLWRRLHWSWLMRQRWPWGSPRVEEAFEFGKAAAR